MRILLTEDDNVLADGISRALRQSGYAVDLVTNGYDSLSALKTNHFDLLILDLGLPKVDGISVLKDLRSSGSNMPVLIITARDTLDDRVKGLDYGADDYMIKPFDLPELEARVRALIRRGQGNASVELSFGDLKFDTIAKRVMYKDEFLDFSAREISMLEIFLQKTGQVVSKEQLLEHIYSWDDEVTQNAIEVNMHRLRKKLEPCGIYIKTVRGLGYLLDKNKFEST